MHPQQGIPTQMPPRASASSRTVITTLDGTKATSTGPQVVQYAHASQTISQPCSHPGLNHIPESELATSNVTPVRPRRHGVDGTYTAVSGNATLRIFVPPPFLLATHTRVLDIDKHVDSAVR